MNNGAVHDVNWWLAFLNKSKLLYDKIIFKLDYNVKMTTSIIVQALQQYYYSFIHSFIDWSYKINFKLVKTWFFFFFYPFFACSCSSTSIFYFWCFLGLDDILALFFLLGSDNFLSSSLSHNFLFFWGFFFSLLILLSESSKIWINSSNKIWK